MHSTNRQLLTSCSTVVIIAQIINWKGRTDRVYDVSLPVLISGLNISLFLSSITSNKVNSECCVDEVVVVVGLYLNLLSAAMSVIKSAIFYFRTLKNEKRRWPVTVSGKRLIKETPLKRGFAIDFNIIGEGNNVRFRPNSGQNQHYIITMYLDLHSYIFIVVKMTMVAGYPKIYLSMVINLMRPILSISIWTIMSDTIFVLLLRITIIKYNRAYIL